MSSTEGLEQHVLQPYNYLINLNYVCTWYNRLKPGQIVHSSSHFLTFILISQLFSPRLLRTAPVFTVLLFFMNLTYKAYWHINFSLSNECGTHENNICGHPFFWSDASSEFTKYYNCTKKSKQTSVRKICNFTINRDHSNNK